MEINIYCRKGTWGSERGREEEKNNIPHTTPIEDTAQAVFRHSLIGLCGGSGPAERNKGRGENCNQLTAASRRIDSA